MHFKALTLAATLTVSTLSYAQVSCLAIGDPGVNGKFVKVTDFGMTRTYEVLEGAQNSLRTYLPSPQAKLKATFQCSLDTDPEMDTWVNSLLNGSYVRKSGSIVFMRSGVPRQLSFLDATPVMWTAPECNANSHRECGMTLDVALGDCDDHAFHRGISPKVQKQWLPANFRLRIEGLEGACRRVNKVEAICVKQACIVGAQLGTNVIGGDLDGDGLPDRLASDLVFTVPMSSATPFFTWHVDAQGPQIRMAAIDYNDDRGQLMHRLSFNCCIVSVTEIPGTAMVQVRCAIASNLVWSPRSN